MAVQNSLYFGIIKCTSYTFSIIGNTYLHCGSNVRLPMRTKSRMSLPLALSMAAEPTACNTIYIRPMAMSSRGALACALAKSEAVASMGSAGQRLGGDVPDEEVYMRDVALESQ